MSNNRLSFLESIAANPQEVIQDAHRMKDLIKDLASMLELASAQADDKTSDQIIDSLLKVIEAIAPAYAAHHQCTLAQAEETLLVHVSQSVFAEKDHFNQDESDVAHQIFNRMLLDSAEKLSIEQTIEHAEQYLSNVLTEKCGYFFLFSTQQKSETAACAISPLICPSTPPPKIHYSRYVLKDHLRTPSRKR